MKKNWQRISTAHHYWSGGPGGGCSRGNYPSIVFPIGNNLSGSTGFAALGRDGVSGTSSWWVGHVCGELTLEWIRKVRGARKEAGELTGPRRKRRRRQCNRHKLDGRGDNNCRRGWRQRWKMRRRSRLESSDCVCVCVLSAVGRKDLSNTHRNDRLLPAGELGPPDHPAFIPFPALIKSTILKQCTVHYR